MRREGKFRRTRSPLPIARLGPLGWSCVQLGHPDRKSPIRDLRTNLAYTLFCRPQVFDEISDSLKRFWEIETLGVQQSKPERMTSEEKTAFEKVSQSLVHVGERYQVAVPWKSGRPTLPNNFGMACNRLRNDEKRLLRKPLVGRIQRNYRFVLRQGFTRLTRRGESHQMSGIFLIFQSADLNE